MVKTFSNIYGAYFRKKNGRNHQLFSQKASFVNIWRVLNMRLNVLNINSPYNKFPIGRRFKFYSVIMDLQAKNTLAL